MVEAAGGVVCRDWARAVAMDRDLAAAVPAEQDLAPAAQVMARRELAAETEPLVRRTFGTRVREVAPAERGAVQEPARVREAGMDLVREVWVDPGQASVVLGIAVEARVPAGELVRDQGEAPAWAAGPERVAARGVVAKALRAGG